MIKYTVTMNPDKTIKCIKDDKGNIEEISESKIAWQLLLLPKNDTEAHESDYKKKHFESINLIVKGKEYNVSFEKKHFNQICKRTAQLQKELRKKIKKVLTIATGTTAAVASLGIGAAAVIHLTAEKEYNPVVDSKYTVEQTLENTQAIPVINEETSNVYKVENSEPATLFTEIDSNKLYDPKVMERNEPHVDLLQRKSKKWGVGYDLLYDILSAEYGGKEANIFHVIFDSWHDQVVTSYNYDLGRYEKVVLTEHPEEYEKILADRSNFNKPNAVDQTITPQELDNPEVSTGFANMVIQYNVKYYKGNILLGILAYNWGVGSVDKLIYYTADKTGYTYDELVAQQDGTMYLNFIDDVELDVNVNRKYLRYVLKHIEDVHSDGNYYYVDIREKDENGDEYTHRYDIKVLLTGQITDYQNSPYSEEQLEEFERAKGR